MKTEMEFINETERQVEGAFHNVTHTKCTLVKQARNQLLITALFVFPYFRLFNNIN